jgi:hypothetical protein
MGASYPVPNLGIGNDRAKGSAGAREVCNVRLAWFVSGLCMKCRR